MTKYLISFPSHAMQVSAAERPAVSDAAHAVIAEMKRAGVYVFGGGVDEMVAPVRVAASGAISRDIYPGSEVTGGFLVIEAPDRAQAVLWASKVATACQCAQELREFMYDPAS